MFYIFFTNLGYYSQETFSELDQAIRYGRSKGFEFSVVSTGDGLHPYKSNDTQVVY